MSKMDRSALTQHLVHPSFKGLGFRAWGLVKDFKFAPLMFLTQGLGSQMLPAPRLSREKALNNLAGLHPKGLGFLGLGFRV